MHVHMGAQVCALTSAKETSYSYKTFVTQMPSHFVEALAFIFIKGTILMLWFQGGG